MSAVLVGLPVIKDARRFHLEKGRRWTVIEHMLLEALARNDWSVADLASASALPRRVVIEVIIRLMRAGWAELKMTASGVLFATTPTGRVHATRDDLPPVTRPTTRWVGYVVELSSGGVFRARDLITLTEDQWQARRAGRASFEVPARLDRHQALPDVQVLADRLLESDEHLTRVDVQDWRPRRLVGLVSVRNGEIEGLGGDIPQQLRTDILRAARRAPDAPVGTPTKPSLQFALHRQPHRVHPIAFRSDDLVMGGEAQDQALRNALGRARSRVVLHSTFIQEDRATEILQLLRGPVQRGAVIDILWGQSRERNNVNATRQAALALKDRLAREGIQDRIRVHMTSTRSHSKLVLADVGEPDRFQALIGSCNWLSSDFKAFDVTLRLREPALLAELAFDLAELARPKDSQIPDFSIEMLRLGRQLQATPALANPRGTAKIVTAPEHADLLSDARDEARTRILMLSHRLDAAARPSLTAMAAVQKPGSVHLQARYGRLGDKVTPAAAAEATAWARNLGVDLAFSTTKLHGKALAWDRDNVVVSSLNFLSADPGDGDPRQELGVMVRAPDAAQVLMAAYDVASAPPAGQGEA